VGAQIHKDRALVSVFPQQQPITISCSPPVVEQVKQRLVRGQEKLDSSEENMVNGISEEFAGI
jgi:hypothetical protein